jgi:hypothetical protein
VTYKAPAVSTSTFADYRGRLSGFILPAIGHMRIKDVKSIHLQRILNDMSGYSADRIGKVHNAMKQLFDTALTSKLIYRDNHPVVNLQLPKTKDGTRRSITPYERKITLQAAKHHKAGPWGHDDVILRPTATGDSCIAGTAY